MNQTERNGIIHFVTIESFHVCAWDREQCEWWWVEGFGGLFCFFVCLNVSLNPECNLCYAVLHFDYGVWFQKRCILCTFQQARKQSFRPIRFRMLCCVFVFVCVCLFIFRINYCVQKPRWKYTRGNVISKTSLPACLLDWNRVYCL